MNLRGKGTRVLLIWGLLPLLKSSMVLSQQQDIFQCPVCGEGKELSNLDGIVTIPQNGDFPCSQLQSLALQGSIDRQTCTFIEELVQTPCECRSFVSETTATATTEGPIFETTFGDAPECYENLNNIQQREAALSLEEVQTTRTYILCPNTVYFMGILDQTGTFDGGFDAIIPRPNVHYKCGNDGSSSNNCRLLHGTYTIVSFGGDAEHSNVIFEGLTIESAVGAGVLAARPGDLTFVDCIFRNHENIGPVHVLFDSPLIRRLTERGWDQPLSDLPGFGNGFNNGDLEKYNQDMALSVNNKERLLQGQLTTLTLAFRQCIFEGNRVVSNTANFGMITTVTPETLLIFDNVIFRNNDYGDSTLKPSTSAIFSRGPLTVTRSCFFDNSFVRDPPIVSIGGSDLSISQTFIDTDDTSSQCNLGVSYDDQRAWNVGERSTCVIRDTGSCQSTISDPSSPTVPVPSPTRLPVPQVTLAPIGSPPSPTATNNPVEPTRGSSAYRSSVFTVALFLFIFVAI